MKLLVIDDEPFILEGLIMLASGEKEIVSEVRGAIDGFEALDILKDYQADLTITDINMPEMNGLEMIREARQQKLCDRFAILTGYDDFHYAKEAIKQQVMDYLLKPINKQEFIQLLRDAHQDVLYTASIQNEISSTHHLHIEDSVPVPIDKQLIAYIHDNYQHDLSLDIIGEHVHLHPGYVSAVIKKITGTTFVQYLREYRIEKAKQLLKEAPHVPVEHIGAAVGYENHRYFYRVFKATTGQTPSQFKDS